MFCGRMCGESAKDLSSIEMLNLRMRVDGWTEFKNAKNSRVSLKAMQYPSTVAVNSNEILILQQQYEQSSNMSTFILNISEQRLEEEATNTTNCSIIQRMFPIMVSPDSENLILTADCKTHEIVEFDRSYEERTKIAVCI